MGQPMTHSFDKQRRAAEQPGVTRFWDSAYRNMFPNHGGVLRNAVFGQGQRQGVDTVIVLATGQVIKIEEKIRFKPYADILLEYISRDNVTPPVPGWIEKDLEQADYLAYGIYPTGECFFFPWPLLRAAWQANKAAWLKRYPKFMAQNPTYKSHNVAVPVAEVTRAVHEQSVRYFVVVGAEAPAEAPAEVSPPAPRPVGRPRTAAAPAQAIASAVTSVAVVVDETPEERRRRRAADKEAASQIEIARRTGTVTSIAQQIRRSPKKSMAEAQAAVDDLYPPER